MQFEAFTEKDFDAYLENKWQSHVFNRERLDVKEKLRALGCLLAPHMVSRDGALLQCEVSAESPALWNQRRVCSQYLFFSRSEEARKELDPLISKRRSMAALIEDPSPLRNHIFLGVSIDKDQLEIALKLHADAAVDRENFQRKCQDYFQREKLLHLIKDLPSDLTVGVQGQEEIRASELDDEALKRLLVQLPDCASWFFVRRTIGRSDAVAQTPDLADVARQTLVLLLPVHDFIAWSKENDHVSMRDTLRAKEKRVRSKGLDKDDRIRVVRGMFAGKTGNVQEVDAKGDVKVRLGAMLVKLRSDEVVKL